MIQQFNKYQSVNLKNFGWEQHKWISDTFSWAHHEYYVTDRVEIVHLVVMPRINSRAPIFGFDVINISGVLTGLFADLTPVDHRTFDLPQMGTPRPRPEWAEFFSKNFVCVKPHSLQDVEKGIGMLESYLLMLPDIDNNNYHTQQQNYIEGQRKNTKTLKMLEAHVGRDVAEEYFYNYLFPDIEAE